MKKRSNKHGIAIIGIAVLAFLAIASASTTVPAYINDGPAPNVDWDKAIAELTDSLNKTPLALDYNARGVAYYYKGNYNQAIADFEASLRIEPKWFVAQNNLAKARQAVSRNNAPIPSAVQSGRQNTPAPVAPKAPPPPPPPPPSPYFTGTGGRGIRLGIIVPESQGLSAQQAYLPVMVQGVLVSNISRYSGISVLDRVSLDRVIAETLDPTYEDNLDIVRLGHVAQVGHMLTGKITRTSSGFTLQLNVTDTTPNAATLASYSGTCTAAQLDDHTAVQTAARELLTQMGVVLTDKAVADLGAANAQQTVAAQTTLARGIVAEKQGNQNTALDYYTQATTLDSALPEAAARFSALADRIQGSKLAEKFDWLRAFAQTGGKYIFEINADEDIPAQTLAFSGKNNITLTLRGRGANRTLSNGFTVSSGVTLILDNNITLRGGVNVNLGGTLIMNTGSTIAGNTGSRFRRDSGVSIAEKGIFTMNGGTITGNRTTSNGGGVYNSGTFTMSGGTISNNLVSEVRDYQIFVYHGGGVYNTGTFTMSGGTISGNTVQGRGIGGGVFNGGTFTMSDGIISGNTGGAGGVYNTGTFTMRGGEISGNANASGVQNDVTFTMSNGTISGNARRGVGNSGTFTMSGGTISGNADSGVVSDGLFTMRGGEISGNTASGNGNGGGVRVLQGGTFTMSNGTISGNTARVNGGGVFVNDDGTFTKTGGTITGFTGDTVNGNAVKNEAGVEQRFKGHAVYAGNPSVLMKIKEGTAGPGANMSYDGTKKPPTASGAWDN